MITVKEDNAMGWKMDDYGHEYYDPSIWERISEGIVKTAKSIKLSFETSQLKRWMANREFAKRVEKVDPSDTKELARIYTDLLCPYEIEDSNRGRTVSGKSLNTYLDKIAKNNEALMPEDVFNYYRTTAMEILQREGAKLKQNESREME